MSAKIAVKWICLASGLLALSAANAQVNTYKEDFSGTSTNLSWKPLVDACLTASGNGPNNTGTYNTIKQCNQTAKTTISPTAYDVFSSSAGPSGPDPAGKGALLLTPGRNNQTGAIISNFTFDTSQGLYLTYTTYTYGPNSGGITNGMNNQGADGIVFVLSDGTAPMPTDTGAIGGALGYSCVGTQTGRQDAGPAGFPNAYLGIGTDEWGNFLNSGDNGPKGSGINWTTGNSWHDSSTSTSSIAAGSGLQFQANRIGIRGAGNITSKAYPSYTEAQLRSACDNDYYKDASKTYTFRNYATWSNAYYVLPNGKNIVKTTAKNLSDATPIVYKLTLSPAGILNFSFDLGNTGVFQPVLTNTNITAQNPPVPAQLRFGFSAGTGGANNVHEIGCFMASPIASSSSVSTNTTTAQVQVGTQIYLASYNSNDWSGTVQALPVVITGGNLDLSSKPNWDANCVLTGGFCASTGVGSGTTNASGGASPLPLPGSNTTGSARVLLTSDSSTGAGLPLQYASLNTAEQNALPVSTTPVTPAATTVSWLRGNRTTEQLWGSPPGTLRARSNIMGDVIGSSPAWVGPPQDRAYPDGFVDRITGSAVPNITANYSDFVAGPFAMRQPVVYAGSNDGFLHGFRTGGVDNLNTAFPNDGQEVLGFMPAGQLLQYAAGLANPNYSHSYVVDAAPYADDLFYNGAWHTWVVGGVGLTGREIYALDVTDPSKFSESNASTLVIGDWTPDNTSGDLALDHLNCTVGTPMIKLLHNGQWGIVFGNGLPDASNVTTKRCLQKAGTYTAGIYIGLIDINSGKVTAFKFLDTKVGTVGAPNGIAYVSLADVDIGVDANGVGDYITDYVYAGDLQGNLWRFDLTNSDPNKWVVSSFGNGTTPTPLFKAGSTQPITTVPIVDMVLDPNSSTPDTPRVMVYFGTGRLIPASVGSNAVYQSGTQTFYGIWDWDFGEPTQPPSWTYAHLSGPRTIATTQLLSQTATQTGNYRTLTNTKTICWADDPACGGTLQYGWKFDFTNDKQEQVIYNPVMIENAIIVNTAEPPQTSAQICTPAQQTGWTMAFNPLTGGGFPKDFFQNSTGGYSSGPNTISGVRKSGVGSAVAFSYPGGNGDTMISIAFQTLSGVVATIPLWPVPPESGTDPARVSWRELKH